MVRHETKQEAQLMLTNPRDTFRGQSRSPSDPWFDKDCLEAKRLTRRLERAYRATCRKADTEISAVAVTSTAVHVA